MSDAITREEKLMQAIATGNPLEIEPITRREKFLKKILEGGGGGGTGGVTSWNDLEDKPTEMVGSDTLTWDGNTDGLVVVDAPAKFYGEGAKYVRLTDVVPTLDDFSNGISVVNTNGDKQDYSNEDVIEYGDGLLILEGVIIVANVDNYNDGYVTYPKKGVYFLYSELVVIIKSITIKGYTGFNPQEKIKEEYLPSTGGGAFVVKMTTGASDSMLVSHTYEEIKAAFDEGKQIALILDMMGVKINFVYNGYNTSPFDGESLTGILCHMFSSFSAQADGTMVPVCMTFSSNNVVRINGEEQPIEIA